MGSASQTQKAAYLDQAAAYDELVSAEDCEGNLRDHLVELCPPQARLLDVGAGTGRISRLLAPQIARTWLAEPSFQMLQVANQRLAHLRHAAIQSAAADLPFATAVADASIAGWVFGHFPHWDPESWQSAATRAVSEMARVTRPGGPQIIIETMGTATGSAGPPNEQLAAYYRWLVDDAGFDPPRIVATDYLFASHAAAQKAIAFFFGDEKAARVDGARVPEFTGVWVRRR